MGFPGKRKPSAVVGGYGSLIFWKQGSPYMCVCVYTQPFISVGSFVWKKREPYTTTTLVGTIMGSEGPWHVIVESMHRKWTIVCIACRHREREREREREWIAKLNYPCYKIHVVDLYVPLHHQSFTKKERKKKETDRLLTNDKLFFFFFFFFQLPTSTTCQEKREQKLL